jgi:nitric-oxide synthase
VSDILKKLSGAENPDEILQLQVLNEKHTPNGIYRSWESHEKIPPCSLRNLLTRFLDITTAPSRQLLLFLASCCEDEKEKASLNKLATESALYEDWKHSKLPHLLEVFEEFPSCKPPASLLISQLTPLQPRFYSISSSQKKYLNEIHLTVAVVNYKNEGNVNSELYISYSILCYFITQMVNIDLGFAQTIFQTPMKMKMFIYS